MRIKKLGKFKSRAGYKKKKRDKERKAFTEKYTPHSKEHAEQEQNVQTNASNYVHDHTVHTTVTTYNPDQIDSYNHTSVYTTAPNYQYSYHQQSTSYWTQ